MDRRLLGYVLGGSLHEGLVVRLQVPAHEVQEGAFVVMEAPPWLFYGVITDITLQATHPRYVESETPGLAPALTEMLRRHTLYTTATVLPVKMLEIGPDPHQDPEGHAQFKKATAKNPPRVQPVKTVPPHFAPVYLADQGDINQIFQCDADDPAFVLGDTREQGHRVSLCLRSFVKRSAGVFGATGTGKSFLTRILVAGLIHHDVASLLIFDMHNEYGFDYTDPDTGTRVDGLYTHFPTRLRVVGLGPGTMIRGHHQPAYHLTIPAAAIRPDDILLLSQILDLPDTAPFVLHALDEDFGKQWFIEFRRLRPGLVEEYEENGKVKTRPAEGSVEAWAKSAGIQPNSAKALWNRLRQLFDKPYISEDPPRDALKQLVDDLQQGYSVVLSFGPYESDLDYLLVTNILTRLVREVWVEMTDAYRSGRTPQEPRPLVVVVEEAHKLLNREMAVQTIFSTIAREMRKYYVTLLIVDQRPSQIYDDVLSQLGTRISGWLGDDEDIRAVLAGLAHRDALRSMLTHLEPKEEALLVGWGIPLPIVVRTRRYDQNFWRELKGETQPPPSPEDINAALFGRG